MEVFGWLLIGILIALAVLLILLSLAVRERHHAVLLAVGAFALFAGAAIISVVVRVELPSPAPTVGRTEKDFYQVRLEEKTDRGTTVVVVKDSSGKFYFSEFDEPLGVKKVLVVEKGKFRSLQDLLKEEPKKVLTAPQK